MAGEDFDIVGKITVTGDGTSTIQGFNNSLDDAGTKTSGLGTISDLVWGGIILGGINLVWEGIKNAIGAMVEFGKSSVASAMESASVVGKMNAVLEATQYAAGMSSEQMQELANSLQQVTRYSDEQILTGATLLLTFRNIGDEAMQRVIPDMLDMAEIFGSVDSAAMQLGKALNDPVAGMGALGRAGVTFSDAQKETIKALMETGDIAAAQDIILDELEAQVEGVAVAYGQTLPGQMDIARNKLDTFKEAVGNTIMSLGLGGLLGSLTQLIDSPAVQSFQNFLEDFNRYIGEGIDPLLALGYALNNIGPQFHDLALDILQVWQAIEDGATPQEALLGWFDELTGMGDTFPEIGQTILNYFQNIDWEATFADLSTNLADAINSVDFTQVGEGIATGLKALAVVIVYLLKIAFTEVDWSPVRAAILNALGDIVAGAFGYADWDALAIEFMMGLEYALVAGFGYMRFEDLAVDFKNGFVYIGQQAKLGLASAFGYDSWVQFTTDLKEGFEVIVNGIKDFLGISSPSTVFASIGKAMIDGLIQGWKDTVGAFLDTVGNTIETVGNLFGIDLSGFLGGSGTSASGLGTAGGGVATGGSGGTSSGGGTVVNQYFYGDVSVGAMSDLISFDCTVNPVVNSTYPGIGGLGGGPVGVTPI